MKSFSKLIFSLLLLGAFSCGSGSEVPAAHTYQVNLENGESFSGTIPNDELIAMYTDIPGEPSYRMITFNIVDGDFEMLVQAMLRGTTVLPIRDPESDEVDGGFVIITPPGTDLFSRYGSESGSMSVSGQRYQETPGSGSAGVSTGLAMGDFTFNCVFKRAEDFNEQGGGIPGTGKVSIKPYF
ncbi:hypothetical protein LZF95_08145 [Algoriphagus sp. AGSA1]|uniref:hypothetical protein n=1 Tax=Algoriphagus sp. AGSA1 TaxID=2907213 RepID=UPI001F17A2C2|nr:hypothetical protein [Algoriphagus sp. AGSA1]MCE7054642.1 hypothetical protein [Algoriphagus sp. AGSA1]